MAIVARDTAIRIERLKGGAVGNDVYLIVCRDSNESVLIDASAEPKQIKNMVKGTKLKYILLTHSGKDCTGPVFELRHENNGALVGVHSLGADNLNVTPDIELHDGDVITFGKQALKVLYTPGHTADSVCFYIDKYLMSGDTLLCGGPGKTMTPDDFKQIIESITSKIAVLPDETLLFPGHGESSVLKEEKEEFDIFNSRTHDPHLCGEILWLSS
ncbi:MAG: MBL fold metallo-hydrolase [Dehalococcoidia bacterium]|nr:MBL fold metallo-hydrolase [Dehalococcoidia bacterium]